MSNERKEEEHELKEEKEEFNSSAHYPSAPSHELFEISTTVDPSYVISLIRKLLPPDTRKSICSDEANAQDLGDGMKTHGIVSSSDNGGDLSFLGQQVSSPDAVRRLERMDIPEGCTSDDKHHQAEKPGLIAVGEDSWEEYGCILWDLAASETHAELMVQNFILEVILGTLMVANSVRVTEIILGILGNLACHQASRRMIAHNRDLIAKVIDQLFVDDTPCLCEACRLLALCLQDGDGVIWAEGLKVEHVLSRILWILDNTLNVQLMEKSLSLVLVMLESKQEIAAVLVPPLMGLGLLDLLINLISSEMCKLVERIPERYPVLDLMLRIIEALSLLDDYSQEISSKKELFELLSSLVKVPDKIEVASSCVTAAVLVANVLSDCPYLASQISQGPVFLQSLFDIFPFASDDREARVAFWSIIARLLAQIQENHPSPSFLRQFVSILASNRDLIEDELLDHQLEDYFGEPGNSVDLDPKIASVILSIKRTYDILNQWKSRKNAFEEEDLSTDAYYVNEREVDKLLHCCLKYAKYGNGVLKQ